VVRSFATYTVPRLEAVIDGRGAVVAEGVVLVSNVRAYGGPFVIAHEAIHDDGLLDVCYLPRGSRLRLLRAMVGCMVGGQRSLSGLRYERGKTVRITADEPVHFQADGDPLGTVPVTVKMLSETQSFIVPPGAPA
jgi:diacylglycerol kinase family enzyme